MEREREGEVKVGVDVDGGKEARLLFCSVRNDSNRQLRRRRIVEPHLATEIWVKNIREMFGRCQLRVVKKDGRKARPRAHVSGSTDDGRVSRAPFSCSWRLPRMKQNMMIVRTK